MSYLVGLLGRLGVSASFNDNEVEGFDKFFQLGSNKKPTRMKQ